MMPDWNSAQEEATDQLIFVKLIHALAGVYIWEFIISLDFEWSFLSGQKKFTWPMIFYFLGRYSALLTTVNILVALNITSETNCQALYTAVAVFTQITIGFASINLALRAMVMCSMSKYCVIPLSLLIAGHWAILLQGVPLTATWVPGIGCMPSHLHTINLAVSFSYSVVLDFINVMLCAGQILRVNTCRSQLLSLMYRDGVTCFVVAVLVNIPAAVFAGLKLNPVMETMFNIPAAVLSTVAVCRAVRRLSTFSPSAPAVYMTGPEVEGAYPYPSNKCFEHSNHLTTTVHSFTPNTSDTHIHARAFAVPRLSPDEKPPLGMLPEREVELGLHQENGIVEKTDEFHIVAI